MLEEIVETEDAVALLGAQVAAREQAAEPAPAGAVARIGEDVGRAVGEDEPRAGMIGERKLLLALDQMRAHHAGDRIAVAEPEAGEPECAACSISSSGCEAPRRKEKFEATANSR